MRITVVTPFFNGSRFFTDTIQSLLNQTHGDWEWIIVDDGSEPEELEALEALCQSDTRIQCRPRKEGAKGANRCRNQGWKNASAEHILFLDSDDLLLPHCLEQRITHSQKSSTSASEVPYFGTIAYKEADGERWLWDDPHHPTSWLASLWSQTPPCQSSGPLWTKAALNKVGGWSEDIQVWQDIDIHQRAYFHGIRFRPAESSSPDILYRIHDKSLSHSDFHSAHKLASRSKILLQAYDYAATENLTADEMNGLSLMTWSVYRNACNLRDWSQATVIEKNAFGISNSQLKLMKAWKRANLSRASKLTFIQSNLEEKANLLFPKPKRKILNTLYNE